MSQMLMATKNTAKAPSRKNEVGSPVSVDYATEGDTRIVNHDVCLLVDPMSIQYLTGAEIDYKEDLEGAQFVIRNPNATTTCGCGSSFSA